MPQKKRPQTPLVPELPLSNKKARPASVSNDDGEEERKAEYRRQEQEKARAFIQGLGGSSTSTSTPIPSSSKKMAVKATRKPTPSKPSPTKPTPKKKVQPSEEVRSTTPPLPSSPELLSPSELKKLRIDELRASAAEDYMRQSRQQAAKVSGVLKAEPVGPPRRVAVSEPFVSQSASVTKAKPKASFLSRSDSVRSNECDAALVPTADETARALRPKTVQFVMQVAGLAVLIWLVHTGHFDVRHLRTFSSAYRYVVPVCVSLGLVLLLFCFGFAVHQLLLVDYSNPQKNYENLVAVMGGLTTLATLVTVLRDLFLSSRKE